MKARRSEVEQRRRRGHRDRSRRRRAGSRSSRPRSRPTRLAVVEIEREINEQGSRDSRDHAGRRRSSRPTRECLPSAARSIDEKMAEIAARSGPRSRPRSRRRQDILAAKTAEAAEARARLEALSKT